MAEDGVWKGVPASIQCVSRLPGGSPRSLCTAVGNPAVLG